MVIGKYRGRSSYQKQWVYGYLFETPLTEELANAKPEDSLSFLTGRKRTCIAQNGAVWEVDPETVGMCSGFHDIVEQEICTGDVMQLSREGQEPLFFICRFGDVEFKIGDANVNARGFYFQLTKNGMKCYIDNIDDAPVKIIGNIIDNPELDYKEEKAS
jgi:hypothetical protein